MQKPEPSLDMEMIDGSYRLVREAKPDPMVFDNGAVIRIIAGLIFAAVFRLLVFGPIHH